MNPLPSASKRSNARSISSRGSRDSVRVAAMSRNEACGMSRWEGDVDVEKGESNSEETQVSESSPERKGGEKQ